MPLKVEVQSEKGEWATAKYLTRSDNPGSVTDNKNGARELYVFRCNPDDRKSVIYKSVGGIDAELSGLRIVSSLDLKIVVELSRGDPPYEMAVQTDRSKKKREMRFTHE